METTCENTPIVQLMNTQLKRMYTALTLGGWKNICEQQTPPHTDRNCFLVSQQQQQQADQVLCLDNHDKKTTTKCNLASQL